MSVTITIDNNYKYCADHDLVTREQFNCDCEGKDKNCHFCKGTGKESFDVYPYEMNIANGNFCTLWNALGLNPEMDGSGSIHPHAILKILRSFDSALVERATVQQGNFINCGIVPEQAKGYVDGLLEIALEAERREERIVWH